MKGWLCILLLVLLLGNISFAASLVPMVQTNPAQLASPSGAEIVAVPQPSEKALRFYHQSNFVWTLRAIAGFLVPCVVLFTGFSGRIRNLACAMGRYWYFMVVLYLAVFLLLGFIISFPLDYWWGFVTFHEFGLSNQTFGKWFSDNLKNLLVTFSTGAAFLWAPYLLLKRFPRRWWIFTAVATVPFLFFMTLLKPLFVDPLFNEFGSMKNQALSTRILGLAEQSGIHGSRIYEVNKSVDTKTVNAYVTGFLGTKRIVLWDTLLAKLNDDEVLYVMGHEMGHYALNHVAKGILFSSMLVLVALYGIQRTAHALINRFKLSWGFDELHDIASFPLVLLLIHLFSLLLTPIGFAYSRHMEHEADRFGLELTRNNHVAATGFVKLVHENLSNPRPGPIYKLLRATHPPLGERIDFMNQYRPWEKGEPLKYEAYFHAHK
ncbi:MAG: Zn-dependent protease with chaperone function [Verrucomicrobiales bacterium]|nr:Zn-dependent protease with chaperone function [Verrucomicrobiales bacterium]